MAMQTIGSSEQQRWDAVEGFRPCFAYPAHMRELRSWSLIAIGALAVAGVFALLLAISRIPGADSLFPWPVAFYEKSLVIHVVFSFVVWFLAGGILFMQIAALRLSSAHPLLPTLGRTGVGAMIAAFALLAIPALLDRGQPSLNNYVPAIIDPVYYVGLLFAAFAAAAGAVRALANGIARSGPLEPVGATGLATAVIALAALIAFAISWNRLGHLPASPAVNEDLFWAGGHILQFLNVVIMIGAWTILGGRALGHPIVQPRIVIAALGLAALLAVVGLSLQFVHPPFSVDERNLFTLYQFALAPAPIVVGLLAAFALLKTPCADGAPARAARGGLIVSLIVFFSGGILGIFVDGTDTRTPAHYHGVIGGVNVALMGMFYVFVLPLLERGLVRWRWPAVSLWLYGAGQFLHSMGLFIAGGYGAPRKVADTAPGLDVLGNWIGHVGIGIGGVIAVLGGIMFIWITARQLLARKT